MTSSAHTRQCPRASKRPISGRFHHGWVARDDERLARASRALRGRAGLRQVDLVGSGRSRRFTLDLEAGKAGRLRLDDIRDDFARFGATVRVTAWWNGADLDRLLDSEHARVVGAGIGWLREYGWGRIDTEVTFNDFGDRGSIDVFAAQPETRSVVVGEIKSAWGSLEETLRSLDVKARLAPQLAEERFGFRPANVAVLLIFPAERNARRIAERHAAILDTAFPARTIEVRRWLRVPAGSLRGLWFVTDVPQAAHSSRRKR